jgi:hypothetical protein
MPRPVCGASLGPRYTPSRVYPYGVRTEPTCAIEPGVYAMDRVPRHLRVVGCNDDGWILISSGKATKKVMTSRQIRVAIIRARR